MKELLGTLTSAENFLPELKILLRQFRKPMSPEEQTQKVTLEALFLMNVEMYLSLNMDVSFRAWIPEHSVADKISLQPNRKAFSP